ncbi:hypothetical protein KIPB_006426 [Kipferlia bialata]|uniref:SWIM-type domain-containing protein n=1 Tax=Kipferlia bialata TaxID=797122 RepID=A0A9K3GJ90_9EUKA|nr:hypothetical protein KIPB_006426 [Kipferlia bialata]|eukprot:g6426.t1
MPQIPIDCQQQTNGYDCGLFALAFQGLLLRGIDPLSVELSQDQLRLHLADWMTWGGDLGPFPHHVLDVPRAGPSPFPADLTDYGERVFTVTLEYVPTAPGWEDEMMRRLQVGEEAQEPLDEAQGPAPLDAVGDEAQEPAPHDAVGDEAQEPAPHDAVGEPAPHDAVGVAAQEPATPDAVGNEAQEVDDFYIAADRERRCVQEEAVRLQQISGTSSLCVDMCGREGDDLIPSNLSAANIRPAQFQQRSAQEQDESSESEGVCLAPRSEGGPDLIQDGTLVGSDIGGHTSNRSPAADAKEHRHTAPRTNESPPCSSFLTMLLDDMRGECPLVPLDRVIIELERELRITDKERDSTAYGIKRENAQQRIRRQELVVDGITLDRVDAESLFLQSEMVEREHPTFLYDFRRNPVVTDTSGNSRGGLRIVLSTPMMGEFARSQVNAERGIVYLDATYGINCYQIATYALIVVDQRGLGRPVAYLIHEVENAENLTESLRVFERYVNRQLQRGDPNWWVPNMVMVDCSPTERRGLEDVWPNADIGFCQFHVEKAFRRYTQTCEKMEQASKEVRATAYARLRGIMHMRDVTGEEVIARFTAMVEEYEESHTSFGKYLRKTWLSTMDWWCDALRGPAATTNNYAESHFLSLSVRFMNRAGGWRLDRLVHTLLFTVFPAHQRELVQVRTGRLGYALRTRFKRMEPKAAAIPADDINHVEGDEYTVKSQSKSHVSYRVTVGETVTCGCPGFRANHQQFVNTQLYCKHVVAVRLQLGTHTRHSNPVRLAVAGDTGINVPVEESHTSVDDSEPGLDDARRQLLLQLVDRAVELAEQGNMYAFEELEAVLRRQNPIRLTERYRVQTSNRAMGEVMRRRRGRVAVPREDQIANIMTAATLQGSESDPAPAIVPIVVGWDDRPVSRRGRERERVRALLPESEREREGPAEMDLFPLATLGEIETPGLLTERERSSHISERERERDCHAEERERERPFRVEERERETPFHVVERERERPFHAVQREGESGVSAGFQTLVSLCERGTSRVEVERERPTPGVQRERQAPIARQHRSPRRKSSGSGKRLRPNTGKYSQQ